MSAPMLPVHAGPSHDEEIEEALGSKAARDLAGRIHLLVELARIMQRRLREARRLGQKDNPKDVRHRDWALDRARQLKEGTAV